MKQKMGTITVTTRGSGLADITREVAAFLAKSGISEGLLTLFLRHTSASLIIQENADADVLRDLEDFFSRLVSRDPAAFSAEVAAGSAQKMRPNKNVRLYRHTTEGPDDMPAHIRAALTNTSLSIPVMSGRLALGVWQAIYLFEHRDAPHRREIAAHVTGE